MRMEEYSYMKTIRFNLIDNENKLEKINQEELEKIYNLKNKINKNNFEEEINQKIKNIFNTWKQTEILFKEVFFEVDKNNQYKINKDGDFKISSVIKIKKPWYKVYFKEGWNFKFKNNNEIKIISHKKINEIFCAFNKKIYSLKDDFQRNSEVLHDKRKNSFFSNTLQEVLSKKYFYTLFDLIKNLNIKNKDVTPLINSFEQLEKEFNVISRYFLSSQSVGIEVLRSSFNSYTINKNSKHYLEKVTDKIKYYEAEKKAITLELKNNRLIIRKFKKINEFTLNNLTRKDLEVIERLKKELDLEFPLNLENSVKFMKLFKATLKSDLFKDCQIKSKNFIEKTKTIDEIQNYSCLFNSDDNLEKIFNLTRDIQEKNKEVPKNTIKIQELKKRRGDKLNNFKIWNNFIDKYKRLSQELGRINANIKNYDKEKYDSQKLQYWNLFLKQNDKIYLLFIPNENWRKVEKKLEKNINIENSSNQIFRIKSLTKRALHKICFNEAGSFYQEHSKDFQDEVQKIKKLNPIEKEKDTLELLKEVLKSDYTNERLDLENFDLENSIIYNTKTLDEFEEELETKCYKVLPFGIDENLLNDLETNYGVFKCEINSYDLNKRFLDTSQTKESFEKRHTKEFWNEFWTNLEQAKVRLNPEVRINFKEKDFQLRQYLTDKRDITDEIIKNSYYCYNRNLNNKFIVQFSFLRNSGKKFSDLGFSDFEESEKHIKDFNEKLNQELKDDVFYLGIDIGEVELASLAVFKFDSKKTHFFKDKTIRSPFLPENNDIKCLKLKNECIKKYEKPSENKLNYEKIIEKFGEIKEKQIISNISYFDDKVEFFKSVSPFGLDLTCAKVINGKIIENADVLTYLQYLKKLAKRRLFDISSNKEVLNFNDMYLDWEYEKNINFKTNTLVLKYDGEKIKNKKGEKSSLANIFTFIYKYEGIKTKNSIYEFDKIKNYFDDYLSELKKKNSDKQIQVPMINNLRDALVSNMIGVLSLLKEKLGNCFIILENEESKNDEDKYLIKRLELALYQKFQTYGLVPPKIKDLMKFRENLYKENNKEYIQIGNIIFVSSEKTSKICPYCENIEEKYHHKAPKPSLFSNVEDIKESDLLEGHFSCLSNNENSCGFSTIENENKKLDEFKVLKSNDIVASYNIAKKGFKFINNF